MVVFKFLVSDLTPCPLSLARRGDARIFQKNLSGERWIIFLKF
jgi:hypothetical protein